MIKDALYKPILTRVKTGLGSILSDYSEFKLKAQEVDHIVRAKDLEIKEAQLEV
jgi:hypothetical protein